MCSLQYVRFIVAQGWRVVKHYILWYNSNYAGIGQQMTFFINLER